MGYRTDSCGCYRVDLTAMPSLDLALVRAKLRHTKPFRFRTEVATVMATFQVRQWINAVA
jgi:hypothetical protein